MSATTAPLRGNGYNVRFESSERMRHAKGGSVQSVVCSPPYWSLKDYGHVDQIGHGETYEEYHARMASVWRECYRALRSNGTMWIVVDKVWCNGELVHIPYDIAEQCRALGFTLLDFIIWNKPTAIAGMTARKSVNKHETIVVLAKSKHGAKLHSTGVSDLWRVVVKAGSIRKTPDHKAPYPEDLISKILACATDEGDLVLDPFLGSGTTAKVALGMRRRFLGYEINPLFREMIAERLYEADQGRSAPRWRSADHITEAKP